MENLIFFLVIFCGLILFNALLLFVAKEASSRVSDEETRLKKQKERLDELMGRKK